MFLGLIAMDPADRIPPDPRHGVRLPRDVGRFGMLLFLASLASLFVAAMIGFAYTQAFSSQWPDRAGRALPAGLWLSTLAILGVSGAMHAAVASAKRGRQTALRLSIGVAFLLAAGFMALQSLNWHTLSAGPVNSNMFVKMFIMLTVLHAAHIIGGFVPLIWCGVNALRRRYAPRNHEGVVWCAWYWHFLDAVWLVMFVLIFLPSLV